MSDIITRPHYDAGEKLMVFERLQDVEPILNHNAALRQQEQKSDWGRHVASVPCVILEKWMNESGAAWWAMSAAERKEWEAKLVAEKLSDPDYAFLRTDK